MNDLKDLWLKSSSREENPEFAKSDLFQLRERKNSPIKMLRRSLVINTVFAVFFLAFFLFLMFAISEIWFRTLILVVCISYLAGILFNLYILKSYLSNVPHDSSIHAFLQKLSSRMKKAILTVEYTAILIYPVAITAGFMLPFSLEGKIEQLLNDNYLIGLLVLCMFILTPLCFWLARTLNKRAFGRYLNEIDTYLNQINQEL